MNLSSQFRAIEKENQKNIGKNNRRFRSQGSGFYLRSRLSIEKIMRRFH